MELGVLLAAGVTAAVVVGGSLGLAAAIYAGRTTVRHLMHGRREQRVGSLVWFEVRREAQVKNEDGPNLRGLYTFFESLRAPWPYWDRGNASVVWLRSEDGITRLYVGVSEAHVGDGVAVRSLAVSLGGRAERCDAPPPIPTGGIALARRSRTIASAATGRVEGGGHVASAISGAMEEIREGVSGALVVSLEMMRPVESRWLEANIAEEAVMRAGKTANYASLAVEARLMVDRAVRFSVAAANSAGSPQLSQAVLSSSLASISTLGWETSVFSPRKSATMAAVAASVATALAGLAGLALAGPAGLVGALVPAAVLVLVALRPGWISEDHYRSRLAIGQVVVPPFWRTSPKYQVWSRYRATRHDGGDPNSKVGNRIAPPSHPQVLSLHGGAAYELVSFPPHLSSASVDVESTSTLSRGLPANMVAVQHPIHAGMSGTNQVVSLDLKDLHYSFYAGGSPNSGKTNLLQVLFAGVVWHGMRNTNGFQITPVWGETKGQGAYDTWAVARRNPNAIMIDVQNPKVYKRTNYRLALEGPRLSDGASVEEVLSNCSRLVSSFQATWGEGIKSSSRQILLNTLQIAMLLEPEEIESLQLDDVVDADAPNIIELAFYLLGGDLAVQPQEQLLRLRSQLPDEAGERERALGIAIGSLSPILNPKDRSKFVETLRSPMNKLIELRGAHRLFSPSPDRVDIYMGQIVERFAPVVLNFGSYWNPTKGTFDQGYDRAVARRLLTCATYLLWDHIKGSCGGWEKMGKRVPIFFDELSDVTVQASSEDVPNTIKEALKEARSRGTAFFMGCQSPAQLPLDVQREVLACRSKVWFSMHQGEDLNVAVNDLASGSRDNVPYAHTNIRAQRPGVAAGIMTRHGTITPPFTLKAALLDEWCEALFSSDSVEAAVETYTDLMLAKATASSAFVEADMLPRQSTGGSRPLVG